jgi:threonine dehydratase
MPQDAPMAKVEPTVSLGAEVVLVGDSFEEALAAGLQRADETGATFVHAFEDERVIAGQGTIGLELAEQVPELETVLVPIGGGGLVSGVAAALKQAQPGITVVGVEPAGAASMKASIDAGEVRTLDSVTSIADGLLAVRPGELNFAHVRHFVDRLDTVSDEEIVAALRWLFRDAKIVAEPSGAVTVAAALREPAGYTPPIVAVISGGNIDPAAAAAYLA